VVPGWTGGPDTYAACDAAAHAEAEARRLLRSNARAGVTVREFWHEWTTDPLWLRPSRSTNVHYRERTAKFVDAFGDLPLRAIGDDHIAAWLKGGRNRGTVQQLWIFSTTPPAPRRDGSSTATRSPNSGCAPAAAAATFSRPGRPRSPASSRSPTS
jgi:hypothetical protein